MGKKPFEKIKAIIVGSLNTDIIAAGVSKLLGPGELTFSGTARIGPGGKSRNIAQMLASYAGRGKVALIGKTVKDPFNLWTVPYRSLEKAGVLTDYVTVESYEKAKKLPGLALIPVDRKGRNQIYVLPGINNDFKPEDLDACSELFKAVQANAGFLGLTLELRMETAERALALAEKYGIRSILDPGGIEANVNYGRLRRRNIMCIKPNEHEAEMLTGVKITGLRSARTAATEFFRHGIRNVLITHGQKGAYLITGDTAEHIKLPEISGQIADSTGCGDQVTATLIAELMRKQNVATAARIAVLAGTLQATRVGIQPVKRSEVTAWLSTG